MSLLVTAFGRFDGGPNCSQALLSRLRADRARLQAIWGGPVAFALFAVDTHAVDRRLARAIGSARPTHVLLTGQAAGRGAIALERVARNRRDLRTPDAKGMTGPLGPVREGGPDRLDATWPDLVGAAAAIEASGVPAALSDDAGGHLCNQTLYLALEAGPSADPPFVATFMHLPLTPEQVAADIPAARGRDERIAIPLDDMARAVAAFLGHTRRAERDRDASNR